MKSYLLLLNAIAIIGISLIGLLSSCNPSYYQPTVQNVLVLKEKEDIAFGGAANLSSSFSEGNYAFNLQGAYAFAKKFGAGFSTDQVRVSETYNGGKGGLSEIGICYFRELTKGIQFNNYVWAGLGSVENHFHYNVNTDSAEKRTIKAGISRIAIQPSISLKHKNFGLALSMKLSSNSYNNIEDNLGPKALNKVSRGYLSSHSKSVMFEPSITLKYGKEHLNLFAQYVYASNLSHSDFPMDNTTIAIGLSYTLSARPKQLVAEKR